MQTLTFECDIEANRPLVLHLPGSVTAGRHRIALVIDPPESFDSEATISPVPADAPPRTLLWVQLEALRAQAQQEGTLPAVLTCDEILAEVERRRGEADD